MSFSHTSYASDQARYCASIIDKLLNHPTGDQNIPCDTPASSSSGESSTSYPSSSTHLSTPQMYSYTTPIQNGTEIHQNPSQGSIYDMQAGNHSGHYAHALDWSYEESPFPSHYDPSNPCYNPPSIYHQYNLPGLAQGHMNTSWLQQPNMPIENSPENSTSSESLKEPASPLQSIFSLPLSQDVLEQHSQPKPRKRKSVDMAMSDGESGQALPEDSKDRRRVQNKLAQRAFRVRSKMNSREEKHHLLTLEALNQQQSERLIAMSAAIQALQRENNQMRADQWEAKIEGGYMGQVVATADTGAGLNNGKI